MTTARTPATDAELRWAYRMARLEAMAISFEQAIGTPCLRACLELRVAMRCRRHRRQAHPNTGAGIERSQPDFSSTNRSNP